MSFHRVSTGRLRRMALSRLIISAVLFWLHGSMHLSQEVVS